MAFAQSLLAGGPSKRPGSLAGTIEALSYLMSGTAEWAELEGSGYSDDDDGDDTETTLEDEDPENLGDLIPLYLIGENRGNETDLAFQALMMRLALEGKIILVYENNTFRRHNCIPEILPGPASLIINPSLLPLIQSCCTARSLLLTQGSDGALLDTLAEIVLATMEPNTPELIQAISKLHSNTTLQTNHIYKWITNNSEITLKHGSKKRREVIKKTWKKSIEGRKPKTLKNLQQLLDALLLSLLEADSSILNLLSSSLELDFGSLDTWNDLIIAHYLQDLHASSEDTPIVFLGDIATIRRSTIERLLEAANTITFRDIHDLPIDEAIKTKKQNRIDEGNFETPVAVISLPKKFPVYLIGEIHGNDIDTLFLGAVVASEKEGLLIHGKESRFYYKPGEIGSCNKHGLENQLASTLIGVQHLIVLLSCIDRVEKEDLLNSVGTTLASITSASDPLLIKAIKTADNNEALKENWALGWIKRNKENLLKKDNFEDRMRSIEEAFKKTIEAKKPARIKEFIDGLRAIKMAILQVQKELPEAKQLTEANLECLRHDLGLNQIDIIGAWRDIFIAENIEKLYLESEELSIPLVVILGGAHIDNIKGKLKERGIEVSSDVMDLPLVGPRGREDTQAKAYIQQIKEEKQARINKEIPEHSEWARKMATQPEDNENIARKLYELTEMLGESDMVELINKIMKDI